MTAILRASRRVSSIMVNDTTPAGAWLAVRMEQVRWGIIGCGDVTEVKSGPGLQKADRSSLVAVMRRDAEACRDYAERHGVPFWTTDADELINHPEVDAVYVATPPDSHADYAIRVLEAGKPVYVEKPMARTGAECDRMIEAAERTGQPLFVAYYRRAMPRFVTVKELLDEGRLGRVHAVTVRVQRPASRAVIEPGASAPAAATPVEGELEWRIIPEVSGGGHFVDLASHTLDLLDHLLGPLDQVQGQAETLAGVSCAEDTVVATWRHASGVLGGGLWSFTAGQPRDEVEIIGEVATLKFSSFAAEPLVLETGDGTELIEAPYPEHVQQPLIQNIVDVLTGHAESAISTGESGARTARVIDTVLADHRRRNGIRFE
ncbi:Gfo/Idh/MocA family protein [Aestuariimicrobium ganziense]|uniref:Gfo/Idh/MocA family protein n=1 Tax=Aestuariimicrobium ganziense TaxID=2773677 RepID=UPI001942031B|nr:Gfo/Idh/MocA family oxidoreductase [Aestuariimicrobium ganziense]